MTLNQDILAQEFHTSDSSNSPCSDLIPTKQPTVVSSASHEGYWKKSAGPITERSDPCASPSSL